MHSSCYVPLTAACIQGSLHSHMKEHQLASIASSGTPRIYSTLLHLQRIRVIALPPLPSTGGAEHAVSCKAIQEQPLPYKNFAQVTRELPVNVFLCARQLHGDRACEALAANAIVLPLTSRSGLFPFQSRRYEAKEKYLEVHVRVCRYEIAYTVKIQVSEFCCDSSLASQGRRSQVK